MQATLDLPDSLFLKAKRVAAQRRVSLEALLTTAVQHEVGDLASPSSEEPKVDANGYPLGYFAATYGSFADEPLERAEQGNFESREDW